MMITPVPNRPKAERKASAFVAGVKGIMSSDALMRQAVPWGRGFVQRVGVAALRNNWGTGNLDPMDRLSNAVAACNFQRAKPVTTIPLIFDCDGVLVDSEAIYQMVELACLAEVGLVYEHAEYTTRFTGLPEKAYIATLREEYDAHGLGPFPEALPETMNARSRARMKVELTAIAGADVFLSAHEGKRAVASSSGVRTLHWKLDHTDLADHFGTHVYSGDMVTHGKPAPDLFLFAAQKLGVAPAQCTVIEDSVNGVRAGVAAGMVVWGFTGGSHADEGLQNRLLDAGAHAVFASFAEMAGHLQGSK